MLIQINTNRVATTKDLIHVHNFRGSNGKSLIIFGVDNSSSVHTDSRNKNILVLGEGPTKDLDNAAITAEAKYRINFTESGKRFVLCLHYNGDNI